MVTKLTDDMAICRNCDKGFRRDNTRNNRAYAYECLMEEDRTLYKRADDTCPLFRKRKEQRND